MAATEQSNKSRHKMSAEHKAALAAGRDDGRAVKAYLEVLEASSLKKGGKRRSRESIETRLAAIEGELEKASALARLQLVQERRDLLSELGSMSKASDPDFQSLRDRFVAVAKRYAERKGISYGAWREVGVDADTLREAGIAR